MDVRQIVNTRDLSYLLAPAIQKLEMIQRRIEEAKRAAEPKKQGTASSPRTPASPRRGRHRGNSVSSTSGSMTFSTSAASAGQSSAGLI